MTPGRNHLTESQDNLRMHLTAEVFDLINKPVEYVPMPTSEKRKFFKEMKDEL